jgi:hypothetical protein
MPVPQGYQVVGNQGPTCFQKLKMGFVMGAAIGASTGKIVI